MQLVLGHQELTAPGGSESYLLTVAEYLQRLGHEVTIFTVRAGELASVAAGRGLRVTASEDQLPARCDGVLAQDGVVSLLLAERYPQTRQLFVAHAPGLDVQRPPQLEDVVSAVIALNDRVVERLGGLSRRHEVVRLRQPVDVRRFAPRGTPRRVPRRVLLLTNYQVAETREMLSRACRDAGMALDHVGLTGRPSLAPESEIVGSDITVGYGRAALEGMASGRAVYVMGQWGGDGWVTPSSYGAVEAKGFAGVDSEARIDSARLRADLASYRPEMGRLNRQLACTNHHAMDHASELVALFRRLAPSEPRPQLPLREMARLVRLQWQTEGRAEALAAENEALRGELEREREAGAAARREAAALKETRRYRLASLLARPLELLRRR